MILLALALACAQPVGDGGEPSVSAGVVGSLEEAARSRPHAERVNLLYTNDAGLEDSAELVVRRAWIPGRGLVVGVEFDGIRFFAEGGTVEGERIGDDRSRVVYRLETSEAGPMRALAGVLPVWPMPALWRVGDDGLVVDPALGVVTVDRTERNGDVLVCLGHTPTGAYRLELDAETFAVHTLDAQLRDGRVVLRSTPIDPGDVESWSIEKDGRRVVDRLEALAAVVPPIETGEIFPDLSLLLAGFHGVELSELMSGDGSGPWTVLLVIDADDEASVYELAGAVASGLWKSAAGEVAGLGRDDPARYWLGHRVVVMALCEKSSSLVGKMDEYIGRAPLGVMLTFCTRYGQTLDRVQQGSRVVAILLDPNRVVGGVVGIDDAETGVESVLEVMRSYARHPEPTSGGE